MVISDTDLVLGYGFDVRIDVSIKYLANTPVQRSGTPNQSRELTDAIYHLEMTEEYESL